jgi:SPX domain protein involved in polyphosphate accumulation
MSSMNNSASDPCETNPSETNPWRYELKLPLQRNQYAELDAWLLHSGVHRESTYPSRTVHSVYLDTAELDDYQDNVAGISKRGKIRLRWYDDSREGIVLELKNKRGRMANKLVVPLQNPKALEPLERHVVNQLLRSAERSSAFTRQCNLFPSLHVCYQREYYQIGAEIRMTVDRDIRYQRLYPIRSARLANSVVDRVVEIKFPPHRLRDASRLLEGMPARVFRHSKYVIGVDSVCDL